MTQRGVGDLFSFTGVERSDRVLESGEPLSRKPTQETTAALLPGGLNRVCSP